MKLNHKLIGECLERWNDYCYGFKHHHDVLLFLDLYDEYVDVAQAMHYYIQENLIEPLITCSEGIFTCEKEHVHHYNTLGGITSVCIIDQLGSNVNIKYCDYITCPNNNLSFIQEKLSNELEAESFLSTPIYPTNLLANSGAICTINIAEKDSYDLVKTGKAGKFKVGDKVKCTDEIGANATLTKGGIYTIKEICHNVCFVEGVNETLNTNRFELATTQIVNILNLGRGLV